jgi:hypothetical protein
MVNIIGTLFERLNQLGLALGGEGGWSLRPHERQLIFAVIEHLDPIARERSFAQLNREIFVERSNQRISVIRPANGNRSRDQTLRLEQAEFQDSLFKVRILVDGKKETANVTFYDGFIFSIETRQPGKSYRSKTIVVEDVEKGRTGESLARIIDRAEHCREV